MIIFMQPWQCIALIVLSIAVFFYASFLDEINETAQSSLGTLVDNKQGTPQVSPLGGEKNSTSTWAEVLVMLDSAIEEDYAISFHEEVLESEKFYLGLLDDLSKSPVAKDLILGPFTSELLVGNEVEILSSLISFRQRSQKTLEIICKGHSTRAAHLLSELIIRNYNNLLHSETSDSPAPQSLSQQLEKCRDLESQMEDLKITIQEEIAGSSEESVEVMAIRSEIMQIDEDVNQFKQHLLRIDEIHKAKLNPEEYFHIPPIRDYGQVTQLADILEQLKSMRLDSTLNEFTRNEVEKNIMANSKELEKEVISAIEKLKERVSELLLQKKELQQAAFDHISNATILKTKTQRIEMFDKIKKLALESRKAFEDSTLLWMSCKSSYNLYRATQ